jgi:threonine aldolase
MQMFGSDNYSSVHPCVLEELIRVNEGHAVSYGDDRYTAEAIEVLQKHLGDECDIKFTWNGTGANVVCLSALMRTWESVLCARNAHINTDETGAPEHIVGVKIVPIDTPDGKLTPALVEPYLSVLGFEHAAQPKVVSISNVTELGTVYNPSELRVLCDFAHQNGLKVHCDGARLANAAASLGVSLRELTTDTGLDALSFGGTKNALMGAEAAVFFGDARTSAGFMIRKQSGQLSSKMRYVAAQFSALYRGDVWLECARHANAMAARLVEGLRTHGCEITQSPDANEVFCILPREIIAPLQEEFHFYTWDEARDEVRLVASWDSDPTFVDAFVIRLGELMGG